MKERIHICFTSSGVTRVVKNIERTDLQRGEYYTQVDFHVPDEYFAKRPVPCVEISIASPYINEPAVAIDPQEGRIGIDQSSFLLSKALTKFGQLLQSARQSGNCALEKEANEIFQDLVEAGIDVRLVDGAEGSK